MSRPAGSRGSGGSCSEHSLLARSLQSPPRRAPKRRNPPLGTPARRYLQEYAATKAMGEIFCMEACQAPELLTVAVAPHQVYGPRDNLFLPNLLETAGTGRLRIFGNGRNRSAPACGLNPGTGECMTRAQQTAVHTSGRRGGAVCFTHNDNYCHGLILAERARCVPAPAALAPPALHPTPLLQQ